MVDRTQEKTYIGIDVRQFAEHVRSGGRKCCRPTGRFDEGWAPNTGPPAGDVLGILVRAIFDWFQLPVVFVAMEHPRESL